MDDVGGAAGGGGFAGVYLAGRGGSDGSGERRSVCTEARWGHRIWMADATAVEVAGEGVRWI